MTTPPSHCMTETDNDDALVDSLTTQLQNDCAVVDFKKDSSQNSDNETVKKIYDLDTLSARLPEICNAIYSTLGSQQTEATCQNCLALELENAGLKVEKEVEIPLIYRNVVVGTRRADLIVTLANKCKKVVMEIKAVQTLAPSHAKQLQWYMHHFSIDFGYLLNFPHDAGFASVDNEAVFQLTTLSDGNQTPSLDTPTLRLKHDPNRQESPTKVQVVLFQRLEPETKRAKQVLEQKLQHQNEKPQWGIASNGLPCRLCEKEQAYCHYHVNQEMTEKTSSSQANEE